MPDAQSVLRDDLGGRFEAMNKLDEFHPPHNLEERFSAQYKPDSSSAKIDLERKIELMLEDELLPLSDFLLWLTVGNGAEEGEYIVKADGELEWDNVFKVEPSVDYMILQYPIIARFIKLSDIIPRVEDYAERFEARKIMESLYEKAPPRVKHAFDSHMRYLFERGVRWSTFEGLMSLFPGIVPKCRAIQTLRDLSLRYALKNSHLEMIQFLITAEAQISLDKLQEDAKSILRDGKSLNGWCYAISALQKRQPRVRCHHFEDESGLSETKWDGVYMRAILVGELKVGGGSSYDDGGTLRLLPFIAAGDSKIRFDEMMFTILWEAAKMGKRNFLCVARNVWNGDIVWSPAAETCGEWIKQLEKFTWCREPMHFLELSECLLIELLEWLEDGEKAKMDGRGICLDASLRGPWNWDWDAKSSDESVEFVEEVSEENDGVESVHSAKEYPEIGSWPRFKFGGGLGIASNEGHMEFHDEGDEESSEGGSMFDDAYW
ncbi:hypothetical protein HDV00_006418 [Rhizophlyctis rosea]|nr:hypothetical protein HDV00_006418 [Rhizophlyctis rosea]